MNILVNRDGNHLGPYTYDQASQLLSDGKLQAWDIAWPDGGREWVTLDQIDGLTERAFALRRQRLAEGTTGSSAGPSAPNAQFIAARQNIQAPRRNWRRVWVWSIMALTLFVSLFIWTQKFNNRILMDDLERHFDNRTYLEGEDKPFDGTAYAHFNDGSIWEKTRFEDGVRHGERTLWHWNGNFALKEKYFNGKLEQSTSFDFNGKPSGHYLNGKGTLVLYWKGNGVRAQEQVYDMGKVVKRTIWNREGQLLSVIPPPIQTPGPIYTTNQAVKITNSPVINTQTNQIPIPGLLPARGKLWLIGNPGVPTPREDIDKRIDLIYANKFYTNIIQEFGKPDEILQNKIYVYWNMRVKHLTKDVEQSQVLFHFVNGYVNLTETRP